MSDEKKPSQQFTLKNDRYRKDRGGSAKFLNIYCAACNHWLLLYQKDGPGNLLRLYLNRIFAPPKLAELQSQPRVQRPQDLENLTCPQCGKLIGTPMRHLDDRVAFRLQKGSFAKKKSDGAYPEESSPEHMQKE